MPYKVLVVAPSNQNLPLVNDEVMQVVNVLGAQLLPGPRANLHGLLDMMKQRWDVVWFATHGSAEGIQMSDGLLNASELTSLLRGGGVRLTVLNTCSSYEVAHSVSRALGTDLVCTVKDVPDRTAYLTGALFAQHLANGLSPYEAYEAAAGHSSTYLFLAAKGPVMPPYERRNPEEPVDLTRLLEALRRVEKIVDGDAAWNISGLVPTVRRMEEKLDTMATKLEKLESNQKRNWYWILVLVTVFLLLLIAVIATAYMQTGGA